MHLLNVVLPVFTLIVVGYVARRVLKLEPRPFARLSLYVLSPGLMLDAVLGAEMQASDVTGIVTFGLLWTAGMLTISMLVGRLLRFAPSARSTLALSTAFSNSANYGLPVVAYAFGPEGFARAAIFVIYSSVTMASLAVFLAAQAQAQRRLEEAAAAGEAAAADASAAAGGGQHSVTAGERRRAAGDGHRSTAGGGQPTTAGGRQATAAGGGRAIGLGGRPVWVDALLASLKMPSLYAVLTGGLLRLFAVPIPTFLERSLDAIGQGALPLLVLILGMQLAGIRLRGALTRIALGTLLRLVVSPALAAGLVVLLGLEGLTGRVLIVEAAMPAAVNTMLVSLEFDADPDVVASTVLVTTVLSLVTLTAVLGWLV